MWDTEPPDARARLDTLPSSPSQGWLTFEQVLRLVAVTVMMSAVVGAAVGLFGVRSRTVSGEAGGVVATVDYAHVVRAGCPVLGDRREPGWNAGGAMEEDGAGCRHGGGPTGRRRGHHDVGGPVS